MLGNRSFAKLDGHFQSTSASSLLSVCPYGMKWRDYLGFVMRLQYLLCLLLFVSSSQLFAQLPKTEREWSDKSGKFKTTGVLKRIEKRHIILKTADKDEVKVPIAKLADADRKHVKCLTIYQREQQQYKLVAPHLERYRESPTAVLEILLEIHDLHRDAPYAAAMIGMAYASGKSDYKNATKYFKLAEKSIKAGQEVLGTSFHKTTADAIRNNIAVCAFKSGAADKGASFLAGRAGELDSIPFCTYHNATLALDLVGDPRHGISLTKTGRKKIVSILATTPPENPGFEVPRLFLYLLEWDLPYTLDQIQQLERGETLLATGEKSTALSGSVFQTEKQLRDKGFTEHLQGTGFLVSPQLLVTNRHVVESKTNNLSYTIVQVTDDGKRTLVGGSIVKRSPVLEEDLALIKLDKPIMGRPLPIDDDGVVEDEEVTVLGFPRAFEKGEHILASGGSVRSIDEERPWYYVSAQLEHGNSGGPCVDRFGNVVGVAFAVTNLEKASFNTSRYRDRGVVVKAQPLVEFIKAYDREFKFLEPSEAALPSRQALTANVRDSVLLVKSWKSPTERFGNTGRSTLDVLRPSQRRNIIKEFATLKENRLYPDDWCPHCNGSAVCKCTNRFCKRGQVQDRKQVVSRIDPNTGQKSYRWVRTFERCTTCGGDDAIRCRVCRDGKIRE